MKYCNGNDVLLYSSNYTQRIIDAKDHASVQINIGDVCTIHVCMYMYVCIVHVGR